MIIRGQVAPVVPSAAETVALTETLAATPPAEPTPQDVVEAAAPLALEPQVPNVTELPVGEHMFKLRQWRIAVSPDKLSIDAGPTEAAPVATPATFTLEGQNHQQLIVIVIPMDAEQTEAAREAREALAAAPENVEVVEEAPSASAERRE